MGSNCRHSLTRYLVLSLFWLMSATPALAQRDLRLDTGEIGGRRVALVVGNDSYSSAPLANSRNDARAVSQTLIDLGFQVTFLEDVQRASFGDALATFSNGLEPSDVALFYFAGHGLQVESENYLIPTDFRGSSAADVRVASIRVSDIEQLMRRSRVALLILDACRTNPFSGTRAIGRGLAPMEAAGSLIAFSTGAGQTAEDGASGTNGLFTAELLKVLSIPSLTAQQVFLQVRRNVYAASGGKQFPAVYDGLLGDFVFRTSVDASANNRISSAVSPTEIRPTKVMEPRDSGAAGGTTSSTVFVYRPSCRGCSIKNPTFVCDGKELAQLNKGYFFQVSLPAGTHACGTTGFEVGVDPSPIDVEQGKQYFVKFSQGMFRGSQKLEVVPASVASREIQKLKSIEAQEIRDSSRVRSVPVSSIKP